MPPRPCPDNELQVRVFTTPPISDDLHKYFKTIQERGESECINDIVVPILRTSPDSIVTVLRTKRLDFAAWAKKQVLLTQCLSNRKLINVCTLIVRTRFHMHRRGYISDWEQEYGDLRYDSSRDAAWAIITAQMVGILRHQKKKDKDFTKYSSQYLIDFAPPIKVLPRKRKVGEPCGEPRTTFALENRIPTKEDWSYTGCKAKCERPVVVCLPVDGEICIPKSLTQVLVYSIHVPVAARLHVFQPELNLAKDDVYRGPQLYKTVYSGLVHVMIYKTIVVDGELVAFVKMPCHYAVKSVNVSLDTMLMQAPRDLSDTVHIEDFDSPSCLLKDFFALIPCRR